MYPTTASATLAHRFGILRRFLHGDSVLVVGPSDDEWTTLLAGAGKALTLVENSPERCYDLLRRFPKASVVQVKPEDFQTSERFDTIVLTAALEQVTDAAELLAHARGWLRPNAHIFAAVRNGQSIHRQMATIMGGSRSSASPMADEDAPRLFDPESLHGVFTQAGLRVDLHGGFSLCPFTGLIGAASEVSGPALTPGRLAAFMQLGERYPDIAEELYVVASAPPPVLTSNDPMDSCRIIQLPKISDPRGNLTFIENSRHVPFDIKRIYYLYDVPGGSDRGGHAHKKLQQFVVALSGSFDVVLNDGSRLQRYHLNRSYQGLYIGPMMWRCLDNFSSGAVCMVLASAPYDESDYYRDYDEFLVARRGLEP